MTISLGIYSLQAQSMRKMFINTTDNAVDANKWLDTVNYFDPMIMSNTESAVGYDASAGLIFFTQTNLEE